MKSKSFLTFILTGCIIVIISACKKKSDSDGSILNDQIVAQWEQVSDSMLVHAKIPGMIIGIWAPDRNLVWIVGKGKANKSTGEKPNPNMKYRMGSLTKTYTYTLLLQLVDEGKIKLTDTLSRYLPDFPKADSVSIQMICNHTSGIFDYTESNTFQYGLMMNPFKKWAGEEIIDLAKAEPYYFPPGTNFQYSNTNTIIAGRVVEQLTGNPVASEIQHRILTPLNLVNTIYPSDPLFPGSFVHGYGWSAADTTDVSQAYDPSMAGAAGAMVTDVYDLKSWVEYLYKGTLLKPETQAQRLTVVPAPGEDCEEYGLGIMHKINPSMWGHTGTIPGYKNWAGYCPSKNVTIVILYNTTSARPMDLATRLINIYVDAVKK